MKTPDWNAMALKFDAIDREVLSKEAQTSMTLWQLLKPEHLPELNDLAYNLILDALFTYSQIRIDKCDGLLEKGQGVPLQFSRGTRRHKGVDE